jgi:hypothetical protein
MSKIALTPSATGTGVFSILSPATNTDRSLTLPDEAGTVLTGSGPINVNASAPNQAVTVDASGHVLVGATAFTDVTGGTIKGCALQEAGTVWGSRNGTSGIFNRFTTDGTIVEFKQDGVSLGAIGNPSTSTRLSIYGTNGSTGSGWYFSNSALIATNHVGALTDDITDLGTSTWRFDDIYATNGTIQTSDRNEKQDIEALSDAEQRVAVACKGLNA